MPDHIVYGTNAINTFSYVDIFYGVVCPDTVQYNADTGALSLRESLQMSSDISNYMMVTFGETTVGVINSDSNWYLFDSHSRDSYGVLSADGYASTLSFKDLDDLMEFLCFNYNGIVYNLTPVVFETVGVVNGYSDACTFPTISKKDTTGTLLYETKLSSDHLLSSDSQIFPSAASRNTCMLVNPVPVETETSMKLNETCYSANCRPLSEHNYCQHTNTNALPCKADATDLSSYVMYQSSHPEENSDYNSPALVRENINKLSSNAKKYEQQIRNLHIEICQSCEKFLFAEQVRRLPVVPQKNCIVSKTDTSTFCSKCLKSILQGKTSSTSVSNKLSAGIVPQCLSVLSYAECRMISQIQSYMTIIILPGGQYAEKGLAIHFPLDLNAYFEQLLNNREEHFLILSQSKECSTSPMRVENFINFDKVKEAIAWLKANNPLYKDFPDLMTTDMHLQNMSNVDSETVSIVTQVNDILTSSSQSSIIPVNYSLPEVDINEAITKPKHISIPTQFSAPSWISQVPSGEEVAFPWLFPMGCGGLTENRPIKLTVLDYFNCRLYNKDSRWRKSITYLMYAVNHMEQSKLSNEIEIQMRLKNVRKSGSPVTAGNLSSPGTDPEIKANTFMFMKNIRGTVAYWADILNNLLCTVKTLGPPTLFITLSSDDCNWPELKMLLYGVSYTEALQMPSCTMAMRKDPLFTSIYFERRWKAFLKFILKAKGSPIGQINDYFGRLEYQNRGSPHIHLFIWVNDAPSLEKSTASEIIHYIDKVISTSLPFENDDPGLHYLVKHLQTHHHTKCCQRHKTCRFGFPRPITPATKIISNNNFSNPHHRGHFYETKRSATDQYINAFNPLLLKRWRANMDIQMVSGGAGLAYYVCNYIAKAEPEDLKHALSITFQHINSQTFPFSLRKQLHLVGNCVLKSRRLSAQEAAARLGHLQFVWSSRSVVYLNTRLPEQRLKLLRPKTERDQLPFDSTDIFRSNVLDYYTDRPDSMENVSLFKFASWYTLCRGNQANQNAPHSLERIKLQSLGKTFRRRQKAAVIRTPKFSPDTDNYFYSLLMLHLPYRHEKTLILPYSSVQEAFVHKHSLFDLQDIHYEAYLRDLEKIARLIKLTNEEVNSIVAPNTDEGYDPREFPSSNHSIISAVPFTDMNTSSEVNQPEDTTFAQTFHSLQVNLLSPNELENNLKKLTPDQLIVFSIIRKHFLSHCRNPLRIYLSGGAGTGKSFLSRLIVDWLRLYTAPFTGANTVLVCAPTGVSAKTIHGTTIHTAFRLPIEHGFKIPQYTELRSKIIQDMRLFYSDIHTIVIDEVSMVASHTFNFINRRLCTIKSNSDYFGGMNMIVIGDFYQLKPVKGYFAFENKILWDLFDTYILETNMRQKEADGYSNLLNNIRLGHITKEDIQTLCSRLIDNGNPNFSGVLRVYPTLKEVQKYNANQQEKLTTSTTCIPAIHQVAHGELLEGENIADYIPEDDREAGGLPNILKLSIGTRVMMIRNIATDQGLVNGAMGFVHFIEFEDTEPIRILVRFDDETIGRLFYSHEHNAIGIEKITQEFYSKNVAIFRTQFPLIPAWACTIHKVQGITCDKIVVDLGSSIFAPGQVYVALSRVKTIQGLGIIALDPTKIKVNPTVKQFYETISTEKKHTHN
ncbi:MAG: DUF6570 domain-containing protein [Candidatus Thiodiazotropha sp.]